jgi:hypothetical protein
LVELRWPLLGRRSPFIRADWPQRADARTDGAGALERRLAALLSGAAFEAERRIVRDIGAVLEAGCLASYPDGAGVQWRSPLAPRELALVKRYVAERGDGSARLYAAAASQANALAGWETIQRLGVEAAHLPSTLAAFPNVRELVLDGVPRDFASVLDAFPALRTLRVRARGTTIDAGALARARDLQTLDVDGAEVIAAASLAEIETLRALDLRDSTVDDLDAVLGLRLHALRLARVARVRSIEALRGHAHLRVLALAGLLDLASLHPLASLDRLESLDLSGLWQFDIADVTFVEAMPGLRRLRVDIGGHRKNVEIYKRRALALPLLFQEWSGAGVSGIENECGVQSLPMKPSSVTTSGSESSVSGSKGVV